MPPQRFLYLRETKSWWCEEGGEGGGEKVSMLTHATARGVGKHIHTIIIAQVHIWKCAILEAHFLYFNSSINRSII